MKTPIKHGAFTLVTNREGTTWVAPGGVHISHPGRAQKVAEFYGRYYAKKKGESDE